MKKIKSLFENEPFNAFWEKGYRNLSISCMGGPSFEVIEIAPYLPPNAKVLDLGCGEGRNSLFLASIGCKVTAVDHSIAGIRKLENIAVKCGVAINTKIADISNFPLEEEYDLVMAHGVLYYLENNCWRQLLTKIKEKTKAGGFNIFTIFIYNEEYPCTDEIQAAHYLNSFAPNEIQQFYQDWQEIRFDQYVKWDSHPGIPMHYHPIEKLVSRKPNGKSYKLKKEIVKSRIELSQNLFHAINMGISKDSLCELIGKPDEVDSFSAKGIQYGISLQGISLKPGYEYHHQATTNGFLLELWYYGKYIIYLTNGLVSGKALYNTNPVRLLLM